MAESTARHGGGRAGTAMVGGVGVVEVEVVDGRSVATRAAASYPLKLLLPNKPHIVEAANAATAAVATADETEQGDGQGSSRSGGSHGSAAIAYVMTYGGGILAGDSVRLTCRVGDNATLVLTTQSSTKVFKSPSPQLVARQQLSASLGRNALLLLLPDPVTCFATARFSQRQTFRMELSASLVLVDWVTCGRMAAGEVWQMAEYSSSNRVYFGGEPLVLDEVRLSSDFPLGSASLPQQLAAAHALAVVVLVGSATLPLQRAMKATADRMAEAVLHRRRPFGASAIMVSSSSAMGRGGASASGCSSSSTNSSSSGGGGGSSNGNESAWEDGLFVTCSALEHHSGVPVTVVRIAATATEPVYRFLRARLSCLRPRLGNFAPYESLGGW